MYVHVYKPRPVSQAEADRQRDKNAYKKMTIQFKHNNYTCLSNSNYFMDTWN